MDKIILITLAPVSHRTAEENLGILYLASSLRQSGYSVDVIDGWLENLSVDDVFNKVSLQQNILYVGISSYMTNTKASVELIKKLKIYNSSIRIVTGGFGPTFYPKDYLLAGSDFVSIGEGEETLVELADYFSGKRKLETIKGIAYFEHNKFKSTSPRPLLNNLDKLPFPSRDTIQYVMKNKSTVNMVSSRGCSGNCEFCSVISFFRLSEGKVWRTRSIKNIVDELEYLSSNGIKYIKFVDDSFIDGNRDEAWSEQFANEILRRHLNLQLRGQIRADKVTDKILYNLKRAGFFSFACGIENGSQLALNRMNKKATIDDNQRALDLFKKHGYIVQMGFILFDKYTTLNELKENFNFLSKNDYVVTKGIFSEMFSAEGTKLNNELREKKELVESDFLSNNNKYTLKNSNVIPIYNGLKKWHKSHSAVYDMIIDPITAPKALELNCLNEFYNLSLDLKKEDLLFFKKMLQEGSGVYKDAFVDELILESKDYYSEKLEQAKVLYKKNDLKYRASINPFI